MPDVDIVADLGSRPWGESYIILGFRLANNLPDESRKYFVDFYFGPDGLKRYWAQPGVAGIRPHRMDPDACLYMVEQLQETLDVDDPQRDAFLRDQLGGLATTARLLRGDKIPFADVVRMCYGVEPKLPDTGRMEEARDKVMGLFGCAEKDLPDVLARWDESHHLSRERLAGCLGMLTDECRQRTQDMIALPEGESVHFELLDKAPWGAYNWYHMGPGMVEAPLSSLVQIDASRPRFASGLLRLLAHECYPGHHTDHATKEAGLYRQGHVEASIGLYQTPECVMIEGIGERARDLIFPDKREMLEWLNRHVLVDGEVPYEPERDAMLIEAIDGLDGLRDLASYRLNIEGRDPGDVVTEVAKLSTSSKESWERFVNGFASHELFGRYSFIYNAGKAIVTEVAKDPSRLRRLYEEQHTPSTVREFLL